MRLAKFWRRINWAWKVDTVQRRPHTDGKKNVPKCDFVKKRAENEKLQQVSEHKNQLRHWRNMQTTWWKHKIKE